MPNGQKFFKLEDDFHVALQSDIDIRESIKDCLKEGINSEEVVFSENKEKRFIFHPGLVSDVRDGQRVIFNHITNGKEERVWLVFRAKCAAIAARFGEVESFGFLGSRPGDRYKGVDYVAIAFPSITRQEDIVPVFVKLCPRGKRPFVLRIEATKETKKGERIVVSAIKTNSFPRQLY